jgi:DNA-directed RNA polymerase III subunit RPC2
MICPSDTPDGESCGLVKTLALLTHITNDLPEEPILHLIINLGVEDLAHFSTEDYYAENNYLIFLNGNIVGLHNNPEKLAR